MEYKVIYLESPAKGFSWNDGLFFIISEIDGNLNICKLKKFGQPQLNDDGSYMITCIGSNNTGIKQTNLIYKDNNLKIMKTNQPEVNDILVLLERKNPIVYEIHRNNIDRTKNLILSTGDKEFAKKIVDSYNKKEPKYELKFNLEQLQYMLIMLTEGQDKILGNKAFDGFQDLKTQEKIIETIRQKCWEYEQSK